MATATEQHISKRSIVLLKQIKHTPYNPPVRTERKNLTKLMNSMDTIGLLHPVTISKEKIIIDGNRRFAAAKFLSWAEIECNIMEAEDADLLYASVNSSARNTSGNEKLYVWLRNPNTVPSLSAKMFANMVEAIGLDLVKRLSKEGYSYRVYRLAKQINAFSETTETWAIVEWLLEFGNMGHIAKALSAGESPLTILDAVKRHRPVKFKLSVE